MKTNVDPDVLSPISEEEAANKIHRVLKRIPVEIHMAVIVEAIRRRQVELLREEIGKK